MLRQFFRSPRGAWLNVAAVVYPLLGWAWGIELMTADAWYANLAGVLLAGHCLTYSAYLVHEFAHQSIFKSAAANNRWGVLMSWVNGGCYASFQALRRKHMRHHIDRADVLTFDYKKILQTSPAWFRGLGIAPGGPYIPAAETTND